MNAAERRPLPSLDADEPGLPASEMALPDLTDVSPARHDDAVATGLEGLPDLTDVPLAPEERVVAALPDLSTPVEPGAGILAEQGSNDPALLETVVIAQRVLQNFLNDGNVEDLNELQMLYSDTKEHIGTIMWMLTEKGVVIDPNASSALARLAAQDGTLSRADVDLLGRWLEHIKQFS